MFCRLRVILKFDLEESDEIQSSVAIGHCCLIVVITCNKGKFEREKACSVDQYDVVCAYYVNSNEAFTALF